MAFTHAVGAFRVRWRRPVAGTCIVGLLFAFGPTAGVLPRGDLRVPSALRANEVAADLAMTAFVYQPFSIREPGCGAISAFDLRTGEPIYVGPSWAGHGGLAAAPDLAVVVATWNQGGGNTVYRLDASAPHPADWRADRLQSSDTKYVVSGSGAITLLADGDGLLIGMRDSNNVSRTGVGLSRLSEATSGDPGRLGPRHGYYGTWLEPPRVILPAPIDANRVFVLTHESRLPATVTDTVKSQAADLHILDVRTMTAPVAPIELPDLVVDDPPGAGLRERGIPATIDQGRIAYATVLADGDPTAGRYIAVSRWGVPQLAIADVQRGEVHVAYLADDLPLVSGIAANYGPENPGLVAVHAGDRVALYEVFPVGGPATELARVHIAPVLGKILNEPRMMGGPIMWSADGSRVIAAANEGRADFVVLEVTECGRGLRVERYVTACMAEAWNGVDAILTANRPNMPRSAAARACPTPMWWPEAPAGGPVLLPMLSNAADRP